MRCIRDRRYGPFLGCMPNNVMDAHQTLNPFAVHHPTPVTELDGDARRPVGPFRRLVDLTNLVHQEPFTQHTGGDHPATVLLPVVVRRR